MKTGCFVCRQQRAGACVFLRFPWRRRRGRRGHTCPHLHGFGFPWRFVCLQSSNGVHSSKVDSCGLKWSDLDWFVGSTSTFQEVTVADMVRPTSWWHALLLVLVLVLIMVVVLLMVFLLIQIPDLILSWLYLCYLWLLFWNFFLDLFVFPGFWFVYLIRRVKWTKSQWTKYIYYTPALGINSLSLSLSHIHTYTYTHS